MTWHPQATKAVISCDKPGGSALSWFQDTDWGTGGRGSVRASGQPGELKHLSTEE